MGRTLTVGLVAVALAALTGCTIVLPGAALGAGQDVQGQELSADEIAMLDAAGTCDFVYSLLYEDGVRDSLNDFSTLSSAHASAARATSKSDLLAESGPIFQSQSEKWALLAGASSARPDVSPPQDIVSDLMGWDYKIGEKFLTACDEITR